MMSGCAQIQDAVGNITGNHSYSKNLTVDGKVDVADGSYSSVKVSDDFLNKAINEGMVQGRSFVDINNPETGQKMSVHPPQYRGDVIQYFFNEFIDSTALEGGDATLAAWKKAKLADGTLAPAAFTREWLNGIHGESTPVLTVGTMTKTGGVKLIHDGKPRMKDANITFGEMSWKENKDGSIVKLETEWSVDYRITDETAIAMLKNQNGYSDEEVKKYVTDEAQDGKGENTVSFTGKADWWFAGESIYLIGTPYHHSLKSVIKPEFHTTAPTAPVTPKK